LTTLLPLEQENACVGVMSHYLEIHHQRAFTSYGPGHCALLVKRN
jgi:hypothetical protein